MNRYIPKKVFLAVVSLLLISAGFGLFYYTQYQRLISGSGEHRAKEIVKRLEKIIDLPDEQPTIAQVADMSKLSSPVLSGRAENGDEILIFNEAKRAILYRPSTKKLLTCTHCQETKFNNYLI